MTMYNQVTGGGSRLTLYRQTAFGTPVANDTKGVVVPIDSESLSVSTNKQSESTITGSRGSSKPTEGGPRLSGGLEIPANPYLMGHVLHLMCGAPTTTELAAKSVKAGDAVDKGGGFVGIPVLDHGYEPDLMVTITGSTKYNGSYLVELGTSKDELVISAPFEAETFTGGETVYRGRATKLKGSAVDAGGGKVGIDAPLHGLNVGDPVQLVGTTGYDGNYTVEEGSTNSRILITKAHVAEDFGAASYVLPRFYKHAFKLPKHQPVGTFEKYLGFDDGAAEKPYMLFENCACNGLNATLGGQSGLKFSVDLVPGGARPLAAPIDGTPAYLPTVGFGQFEVSFYVDGVRRADVNDGQLSLPLGVEGQTGLGSRGKVSRFSFGDPEPRGTLNAFLVDDDLQMLADQQAVVRSEYRIHNKNGEELHLIYPKAVLDTEGPQINTKTGIMQQYTVMGFVEGDDSIFEAVLINRDAVI